MIYAIDVYNTSSSMIIGGVGLGFLSLAAIEVIRLIAARLRRELQASV
jgi:hypothetical protein